MGFTIRSIQLAQQRPDTEQDIARRAADREISAKAVLERVERWPILTPWNAQEAIDWQTARIAELRRERGY